MSKRLLDRLAVSKEQLRELESDAAGAGGFAAELAADSMRLHILDLEQQVALLALRAKVLELEERGFAMMDAPEDTLIACWNNHEQEWVALTFNSKQGWWEFGDEKKPYSYFYDLLKWRNL